MSSTHRSIALAAVIALYASLPCRAQCLEWDARFGAPGLSSTFDHLVYSSTVFDDGSGPALYAGGQFSTANGIAAKNVAKWDGTRWSALGSGTSSYVRALCAFDDGSGAALYAGGNFTTAGGVSAPFLAKWNGTTWSSVGAFNGQVFALLVYDDGLGPRLYATGSFTMIDGSPFTRIAKWDGSSWASLSTGLNSIGRALTVWPDPTFGSSLVVSGEFGSAGGVSAARIALWNGASWFAFGTGLTGGSECDAVTVFDDGGGPELVAGGNFTAAGGTPVNRIAKWDGSTWTALGNGVTGAICCGVPHVLALTSFDDGSGSALYAGGGFFTAGSVTVNHVARWDGTNWSAVDAGVTGDFPYVRSLTAFDDGGGAKLYMTGDFDTAGGTVAHSIARWDGANWGVPPATHGGLDNTVFSFATFDDGGGDALYVGGDFSVAGTTSAGRIARWDGSNWAPLGSGADGSVRALCTFDDGSGDALYAGGAFTDPGGTSAFGVGKWDGTSWSALGSGLNGTAHAMAVFDDGGGPALFVGGNFTTAGGSPASSLATWNGSSWSDVGGGTNDIVYALCVWDDGSGPALYAGGKFTLAGGAGANRIAKWNGTSWTPLNAGILTGSGIVYALTVFDDGVGAALYVGGQFNNADSVPTNNVAKWNGTSFQILGSGASSRVEALATFNDKFGTALYAGGAFGTAGSVTVNRIAKWDGFGWSALDGGLWSSSATDVYALAAFDDGWDGAPDLYAGGSFKSFTSSSGPQTYSFAQWQGCPPGTGYCYGDGLDSVVTTPCPCGNFGDEGRGCANSNALLGGARLIASGYVSPNTIQFTCDGIPNNTFCTFLRSNASLDTGFVFGDGIKCLNGTGIRFSAQNAGQNGNPPNTVSSGAQAIPPGNTRYYQLHYRNPNAGFCPPETFNISNAYRLDW